MQIKLIGKMISNFDYENARHCRKIVHKNRKTSDSILVPLNKVTITEIYIKITQIAMGVVEPFE